MRIFLIFFEFYQNSKVFLIRIVSYFPIMSKKISMELFIKYSKLRQSKSILSTFYEKK